MASIVKRTWTARGLTGHRVKRVAFGYSVMIDTPTGRRRVKRFDAAWRTRAEAAQALAAFTLGIETERRAAPAPGLTLAAAFDRYFVLKARKRSLPEDRRQAAHLLAAFGATTPLGQITAARISEYKAARLAIPTSRRGGPLSAASINRPLALLRHLLRLAHEEWELLAVVPTIRQEREPEGRVVWLTPEAEAALLTAARASGHPDLADLLVLAIETGMRQGELLALDLARVDLARGVISLAPRGTKSKRRREIPMRQAVYDRLAARRPREGESPYVFAQRVWTAYRNAFEAVAAVVTTAPDGEPLTFHGLRHHFASWFVMRGGRLETLARILGHSTLAMTHRYVHLAPDFVRGEMVKTEAPARSITTATVEPLPTAMRV